MSFILGVNANCCECDERWEGCTEVDKLWRNAREHAKKTGHRVDVEVTRLYTYDYKEGK